MITTKFGDSGNTTIKGNVISKDSLLVEALGSIDEAQAWLLILNTQENNSFYLEIIKDLYIMMGAISGYDVDSSKFDERISAMENIIFSTPTVKEFTYPTEIENTYINMARTVVRRAERNLLKLLKSDEKIGKSEKKWSESKEFLIFLRYLNRLSDFLFALYVIYGKGGIKWTNSI